jgi:glycylpeptide N-tetradecanoyltransferase
VEFRRRGKRQDHGFHLVLFARRKSPLHPSSTKQEHHTKTDASPSQSTVLKATSTETIRAAYLYYYASETAFASGPTDKVQADLKTRLDSLVNDALILAKKDGFHVFNALTLLDNPLFLKDNKFEPGDGKLNFYLFNWRTPKLGGGVDENNQIDKTKMDGVGVVML